MTVVQITCGDVEQQPLDAESIACCGCQDMVGHSSEHTERLMRNAMYCMLTEISAPRTCRYPAIKMLGYTYTFKL